MQKKSRYSPVLIGVVMLFIVALGMGGIAYSFYRTEIAEEQEESSDMANDDSPFEQLKKEQGIVITPVPQQEGGSGGIDLNSNEEGIPTGTYSNPPAIVDSTAGLYSAEPNRPLNNFSSSVESNQLNQERFSNDMPNYTSPSSSNNFNSTSDNSLVEPLDNSDLLESPDETDTSIEASPLENSSF